MDRPYAVFARHPPGGEPRRHYPRRRWICRDRGVPPSPTTSCRRSAVGLDYDDRRRGPTIEVPGHWRNARAVRRQRRPVALPQALRARRRARRAAPVRDVRRHLLPGRRVARRRLPRRPGGLLLPPHVRHHRAVPARPRARAGRRGRLPAATQPHGRSATSPASSSTGTAWIRRGTRVGCGGRCASRRTGPVRIDRWRVLCRDANDTRAHLRLHARLDSDAAAHRAHPHPGRRRSCSTSTSSRWPGGLNEVDWNLDIDDPRLWWPWTLGEQELTDVDGRRSRSTTSSQRHAHACAPGCARSRCRTGCSRVNGEPMFVKGANLAPTRMALGDGDAGRVPRATWSWPAKPASTCCASTATSPVRSCTTPPTSSGCCCGRTSRCSGATPARSASEAVRQAREAVDQLGHHPSIAVWCAHNEPVAANSDRSSADGQGARSRYVAGQQLPSWNKTVLDRWVKRAFEQADETRPDRSPTAACCPTCRCSTAPTATCTSAGTTATSATSPGFAAIDATHGALRQRVRRPGGARLPPTSWSRSGGPTSTGSVLAAPPRLAAARVREARAAGRRTPRSTPGGTATQTYQATVLRHHIETLRRLKYRPTGGFCFFMLNDSAPTVSWSVLDHERHPKLAYQAVVDACRPVIVVADRLPATCRAGRRVWRSTCTWSATCARAARGHGRARPRCAGPAATHDWRWAATSPPDSCVRVGTIQFVVARRARRAVARPHRRARRRGGHQPLRSTIVR